MILASYTYSTQLQYNKDDNGTLNHSSAVPSHEVIFLASIFVPDCNVHKASLLIIEVEVKLLSPLWVQCFGNGLKSMTKEIHKKHMHGILLNTVSKLKVSEMSQVFIGPYLSHWFNYVLLNYLIN